MSFKLAKWLADRLAAYFKPVLDPTLGMRVRVFSALKGLAATRRLGCMAHIRGDVDFESARRVASAITPVPGGVGPLTNALLLTHLIRAAERQAAAR